MLQFRIGERNVLLMLPDVIETSFWHKIRNAYDLWGRLDIDTDVKIGGEEVARLVSWLKQQRNLVGGIADTEPCPRPASG